MSVERLARALGILSATMVIPSHPGAARWVDPAPNPAKGNFMICALGSGEWRIAMGTNAGRPPSWDVDEGTALIFLLTLASGLRLDVGRCPGCVPTAATMLDILARDSMTQAQHGERRPIALGMETWRRLEATRLDGSIDPDITELVFLQRSGVRLRFGPCPECSEPGPPVACGGFMCHDGQKPTEFDYVDGQGGERVRVITRSQACHACHGTGKKPGPPQPTGRRILGAEAILKAMPREWVQAACGRRGDDAIDYLRGIASRQGAVFMDQPEWVHGIDGQMQVRMRTPGDQPTRDALAVRADELQAEGDPLGELIAAWLAGECKVCEGSRAEQFGPLPGVNAECRGCCPPWPTKFWPTGTVLGADWPKLEALVAATCERLE